MQTFSNFVRLIELRSELNNILERYGVDGSSVNLKRRWKTIANDPDRLVKGRMDHRDRSAVVDIAKTWGELS